jgi:hypothetical protein
MGLLSAASKKTAQPLPPGAECVDIIGPGGGGVSAKALRQCMPGVTLRNPFEH